MDTTSRSNFSAGWLKRMSVRLGLALLWTIALTITDLGIAFVNE